MPDLDPRHFDVLRRHVAAESAFDLDGTLATLTPDCVFEDMPSGHVYRGHEGVRRYYRDWWAAFGNVPRGGQRHVVAPDRLIVETRFGGHHRGVYQGHAPSGRPIDLPVAIVVDFRDGLMSGERFYYDRRTLLEQIGAA